MSDIMTKAERSKHMSRIRGKHSAPERLVRSLLHRMGLRFRLHNRSLPGTPDIVLAKHGQVIFVHGCFWHRHSKCRYATIPASNQEFWLKKFGKNTARDRRNIRRLKELGWKVLVVWECQTRNVSKLQETLTELLLRD